MSTVHVLPVNDLIEHDDKGTECVCIPDVEHVPGDGDGWLITHHSLDGRETRERPAEPWQVQENLMTYASRDDMLEALLDAEIMIHRRPGMTAGQLAERLPTEVRATYWRRKLAEWAVANGYEPDKDEA